MRVSFFHFNQTTMSKHVFAYAITADRSKAIKICFPSCFNEQTYAKYWPQIGDGSTDIIEDRRLYFNQIDWNDNRKMFFCNLQTGQLGKHALDAILHIDKEINLWIIFSAIWPFLNNIGRASALQCLWLSRPLNLFFEEIQKKLFDNDIKVINAILMCKSLLDVNNTMWKIASPRTRIMWLCSKWFPDHFNLLVREMFKPEYSCNPLIIDFKTRRLHQDNDVEWDELQALFHHKDMSKSFQDKMGPLL
jgi:hypothetical protein